MNGRGERGGQNQGGDRQQRKIQILEYPETSFFLNALAPAACPPGRFSFRLPPFHSN